MSLRGEINICSKKVSPVDFNVWLDENALSEILVRLPVMSITRFKLVCKSWCSLISSDYFRCLHTLTLRKSPPPLFLTTVEWKNYKRGIITICELSYLNGRRIIESSSEKQRIITIPCHIFKLDQKYFEVVRSSNGLLLLRNCRLEYYVYNPTTNYSDKPSVPDSIARGHLRLVFDPSKSPHYKIVLIREMWPPGLQFNVFKSESRTWSVCVHSETMTQYKSLFYLIHRGITGPGLLYFFSTVKNVSQYIVCPLPQVADQLLVYSYTLQEENGSLYYCAFVRDVPFQSTAVLWELQLNGDDPRHSNWLLKYHHKDPRLPGASLLNTLAFVTQTSTALIYIEGKIMAYSFVYKSYTEVVDIQPGDSVHVHQIAETLALS